MNIVRVSCLRVSNLPKIEKFGKNDPFIKLSFGENSTSIDAPWAAQTTVQEDAGAEAEWHYDDQEATMLFPISGRTGERLLSCTVYEHNALSKDGYLGSAEIDITNVLGSNKSQTFQSPLKDEKGKFNGAKIEITCVSRGKPREFAINWQIEKVEKSSLLLI
jgi:hypothetical protein